MIRKMFKPGDKVKTRDEKLILEIVDYAPSGNIINRFLRSRSQVLCKWKESNKVKYKVFHQNNLVKEKG